MNIRITGNLNDTHLISESNLGNIENSKASKVLNISQNVSELSNNQINFANSYNGSKPLTWNNLDKLRLLKYIKIDGFVPGNCGYPSETEKLMFFTDDKNKQLVAINKKSLEVEWRKTTRQIFSSLSSTTILSSLDNYKMRYAPGVSNDQKRLYTVIEYKLEDPTTGLTTDRNYGNILLVLNASTGNLIEIFKFNNYYSVYGQGWDHSSEDTYKNQTTKLSTNAQVFEVNGVTKIICGFRSSNEYAEGLIVDQKAGGINDINEEGLVGGIICLEKNYINPNSEWKVAWHSFTTPKPLKGFGVFPEDPSYNLYKDRCNFESRTVRTDISGNPIKIPIGNSENYFNLELGPYYPDSTSGNQEADKLTLDSYVPKLDNENNIIDNSYQDIYMYIKIHDGYKFCIHDDTDNSNNAQHNDVRQYLVKSNYLCLSSTPNSLASVCDISLSLPFYVQSRNILAQGNQTQLNNVSFNSILSQLNCTYIDDNDAEVNLKVTTSGNNLGTYHIETSGNTVGTDVSGYLTRIQREWIDCQLDGEQEIDLSTNNVINFKTTDTLVDISINQRMLCDQEILKILPTRLAINNNYYLDAAEAYRLNYYGNSVWTPRILFDKYDNTALVSIGNGNSCPFHELQNYYFIKSEPEHPANNGKWWGYCEANNNPEPASKKRNSDIPGLEDGIIYPPLPDPVKGVNTNQISEWIPTLECTMPIYAGINVGYMQKHPEVYSDASINEYIIKYRNDTIERIKNPHKYLSKRGLRSLTNSIGSFDLNTGELIWRSASFDQCDHFWQIWYVKNLLSAFYKWLPGAYESQNYYLNRRITLEEVSKTPTTPDNDIALPAYKHINGYIYASNKGGNAIRINLKKTSSNHGFDIKETEYIETSLFSQDIDQGDHNYQWCTTNDMIITRHSGNNQLYSEHVKYNSRNQKVETFKHNTNFLSIINPKNTIDSNDVHNVSLRHPDPSFSVGGYGGSTGFIDSETGSTIGLVHDQNGMLVFVNTEKIIKEESNNLNNQQVKFFGTKVPYGRAPTTVSDNKIYVQSGDPSGVWLYLAEIGGTTHLPAKDRFDSTNGIKVYGIDDREPIPEANYTEMKGYSDYLTNYIESTKYDATHTRHF